MKYDEPEYRREKTNVVGGPVELTYPEPMAPGDVEHLEEWLQLLARKLKRRWGQDV